MYLSDIFTVSANLAGIPGVSIPCGFAGGLPVGLQLLGPPLEEARLLRLADAYQRRTDFHARRPPEAP
jgi:aspartyl-tRNA(Asn)/glutamyl-tRNA(Gln) amidotransferase subunit A